MDLNYRQKIIEGQLIRLEGNGFQDLCDRLAFVRALGDLLQSANEAGFEILGGRNGKLLTEGISEPPSPFNIAEFTAMRKSEYETLSKVAKLRGPL